MAKVALIRCESYEYETVLHAVNKGIQLIGGSERFASNNEKILVKPNMLAADPPEKCSVTHPAVFKAVCEVLKTTGAKLTYGDSPGFHTPEQAAKKIGIADAASDLNIEPADFINGKEIFFDEGRFYKRFVIANGVLNSNGLISVSKMKSHGLTLLTGAVKNQFGCIPGFLKGEFHVKLPNLEDFAKMLVDLNLFLKPRLFIMDGVFAMEGNGPRGGTPKKMNLIAVADDPIALDTIAALIVGTDPGSIYTIKYGTQFGLGTSNLSEIELYGETYQSFISSDFKTPAHGGGKMFKLLKGLDFLFVKKPYVVQEKCIKCGVCIKVCPVNPKAISWKNEEQKSIPVYNYNKCIKCYCCQEMCPESAIDFKKPLLRKLIK